MPGSPADHVRKCYTGKENSMEENTGQATSIDEECSEVPTAERRTIPREILPVKRTVLATISGMDGEEEQQLYLHINDISEKGMRITTDIFVPEDNRIRLRFLFDQPLEIEARTVWAKELGKGNYVMGLELFQDSEIQRSGSLTILCDMQLCMTYSATS
jgi:hypothetical protein